MPSSEDATEALPSVPGISGSPGYGRGRPVSPQPTQTGTNISEENRHAHPVRRAICGQQARPSPIPASATPRLMGEDAVKQALGILTKRAEETGFTEGPGAHDGTGRVRGRGRGRGIGARGRGRGHGRGVAGKISAVDDTGDLFLGDHMDGEWLVERIGEDKWNEICEAIDSVSGDIVPDPLEDIYENALHTNMMVSICLHSRGHFNSSSLLTGGKTFAHYQGEPKSFLRNSCTTMFCRDSILQKGREEDHSPTLLYRVAVLDGDFLFAQSLWYLENLKNIEVIKLISQVIKDFANAQTKKASSLLL